MTAETLEFRVDDSSQTSEARRAAMMLAAESGYDEIAAEHVAIVVTELCTNLLKHAGGGRLLVSNPAASAPGDETLQVVAVDKGPGMDNVADCFRDGFTTSTSPGNGLGAIGRLSDTVDIYSLPGRGTALVAKVGPNGKNRRHQRRPQTAPLESGAIRVRMPRQEICGDDWILTSDHPRYTVIVADGLGHGSDAARASGEAIRIAGKYNKLGPRDLVDAIHAGLRSTRGAAVAVAQIDLQRGTIAFSGAGNIAASVAIEGERVQHLVSGNGTAGHQMQKVQQYSYPWSGKGVLLMHSDGVSARWNLASYPGLLARDPAIVAAVLYRDFSRHTDDATMVAVRAVPQSTT